MISDTIPFSWAIGQKVEVFSPHYSGQPALLRVKFVDELKEIVFLEGASTAFRMKGDILEGVGKTVRWARPEGSTVSPHTTHRRGRGDDRLANAKLTKAHCRQILAGNITPKVEEILRAAL